MVTIQGLDFNSLLTNKGMTLELIIWSMFVGIVIGAFTILYNKTVLGAFVRALNEEKAATPGSAKTLDEIGFGKNYFVMFSLSRRGTYRKIIHAVPVSEEDTAPKDGTQKAGSKKARRYKLSKLKFYIPDEMRGRADSIYSNDGANLIIVLISVVLFLIIALLSFTVIPDLIQMLKNFINYVTPKS